MKYFVTVNGKKYEVDVERAGVGKRDGTQSEEVSAAGEKTVVQAGAHTVLAPMPGQITEIKVSAGQVVQKGQILLILEAMKMENEILADSDGIVKEVAVSKGANVNTGDLLLTL